MWVMIPVLSLWPCTGSLSAVCCGICCISGHANWADSEWAFYGPRMELLNPPHKFTAFDDYGHSRKDDTIPVLLVMQAAQADVFDVSVPFFNPITVFKTLTLDPQSNGLMVLLLLINWYPYPCIPPRHADGAHVMLGLTDSLWRTSCLKRHLVFTGIAWKMECACHLSQMGST
ncbi:hypothetical protein BKA82DRAFT_4018536 [Pisolithus tinctorius]|nr:hypothetical protein BKA82DRAFT_4018536 [Pisolithus tinctorius]